ncbi:MAG: (2Fe-2S)-binding protein [Candidatus Hydrogenedens sp.]|nr:(2Fe-2S)-binding protein [Candidatus Hydrogenedens sp.]
MAIIVIDGEEMEVADGSPIADACEDAGVPLGCRAGLCGSCVITIEEGMENLEDLTSEEEDMGLGESQRLACQAVIRSGKVIASY